jgi:hypothetical protein
MTNVGQIAILSVTLLAAVQTRQSTAPASTLTERDRVEIQELVARYARALSTCAAKEYAELFTPDACSSQTISEAPGIGSSTARAAASWDEPS